MDADRWSVWALAREAVRNIAPVTSRLFPLAAVAVVFGFGGAALSAVATVSFDHQVAERFSQGRTVIVFEAAKAAAPSEITRASCERLADDSDVQASGMVAPQGRGSLVPWGDGVPVNRVSASLLPTLRQGVAVLGPLLTPPRNTFALWIQGNLAVATPGELSPEGLPTNAAVSIPLRTSDRASPSCTVILNPNSVPGASIARLQAELSAAGGAIVGHQVSADTIDPIAAHLSRADRYLPLLLGLIGGTAQALINRTRQHELAAYRYSGTSRTSLSALLTLEASLIASIAGLSFALTALVGAVRAPISAADVLALATLTCSWIAAASILTLPISRLSAAVLARER